MVESFEIKDDTIILNPVIYQNVAIYGYPGKKAGLEINDLRKTRIQESPLFKIFMLHTTLDEARGTIPMDSIKSSELPKADYYALGHLHLDFQYENFVYPGPVFPNNFQELEDLQYGSFYIVNTDSQTPLKKIELKIKGVETFNIKVNNSIFATEQIISEIAKRDIEDKIILLRIRGDLEKGNVSDIKFQKIEEFIKQKKAYFMLKNTHELKTQEVELDIELKNSENIEEETIKMFSTENPSSFNELIPQLINSMSLEKQEDEKSAVFEERLLENVRKIIKI
jgi:DNA repair exonuclease SbcCD nuclease subunit